MLCTSEDKPFDDPDWIYEPKLDGLRVLVRFDGQTLRISSRNDRLQNVQFPEITRALKRSFTKPIILDGEIVCLDARGRSSFQNIQHRFHVQDPFTLAKRVKAFPAHFYAFDLLYYDRFDVRTLGLMSRKILLKHSVQWTQQIHFTEYVECEGKKLLQHECTQRGEGIVAKRKNSSYSQNRSGSWIKLKCLHRQELVIGGFTDPGGARSGLGAILLGYYNEEGRFFYCGKVGTGFDGRTLGVLRQKLDQLKIRTNPFHDGVPLEGKGIHWVKPQLVCEIAFSDWTAGGALRHGRFEGLRYDKNPRSVRRELASNRTQSASRPSTR